MKRTYVQTALETARLISNAFRSKQTTDAERAKRARAKAADSLKRPTQRQEAAPPVVNFDSARQDVASSLLDAVADAKAQSKAGKVVKPPVAENADVAGMVLPTTLPVAPNMDKLTATLQAQLAKLAQDAQKLQDSVQSAEMAALNEQRIRIAMIAISKKLNTAQFEQFKQQIMANLASNKVIGDIINRSLTEVIAQRERMLTGEGAFLTDTVAQTIDTTKADQQMKIEAINQDFFNLVQSIFLSRGSTSELTKTLQVASADLDAKIAALNKLRTEGANLTTIRGVNEGILKGARDVLNGLNNTMLQLTATLDSVNQALSTSTFDPEAKYPALLELKASVEANIKGIRDDIAGLQAYMSSINLAASLSAIDAAIQEKGAVVAQVTASVDAAITSPDGARDKLTLAENQYASALASLNGVGGILTRATDGTDGPTMGSLVQARGDKPVEPATTAPPINEKLQMEFYNLAMSISDTASIQDTVNRTLDTLGAIEATQNSLYETMHGPNGFIAKRDRLNELIRQLSALKQDTADKNDYAKALFEEMNVILNGLGYPPAPDRTKLDAAIEALAKLNTGIEKTERLRREAIQGMQGLSERIMKYTIQVLNAQYMGVAVSITRCRDADSVRPRSRS